MLIKGKLGLNYDEVSPFDVPTSNFKGLALRLNLHFFDLSVSEGSTHAEVYYPIERKKELLTLLGEDVIIEGEYIGDETRGNINSKPIICKKIFIATIIKRL